MDIEQKINAICLHSIDYKDNDKIIYLLTEQGKMSALIKGVKKPKAKLKPLCQPFCFGEYIIVKKGDLAVVTNASIIDANFSLLNSYETYELAKTALSIAYKLSYQIQNDKALYNLTLNFFNDLKSNSDDIKLLHLLNFYLYDILIISGYGIHNYCNNCGEIIQKEMFFNEIDGNIYCDKCNNNCKKINIEIFDYLKDRKVKKLDENIIKDTNNFLKQAIRIHLDYII